MMTIQLYTDNNIAVNMKLKSTLISFISEEISKYSHQMTKTFWLNNQAISGAGNIAGTFVFIIIPTLSTP